MEAWTLGQVLVRALELNLVVYHDENCKGPFLINSSLCGNVSCQAALLRVEFITFSQNCHIIIAVRLHTKQRSTL